MTNRKAFGFLALAATIALSACSSEKEKASTQTETVVISCTVVDAEMDTSNNEVQLSVFASGGSGPYVITNVSLGANVGALVDGSASFSSVAENVYQFASLSFPPTGTVTVREPSSNSTTTCDYAVDWTPSTPTPTPTPTQPPSPSAPICSLSATVNSNTVSLSVTATNGQSLVISALNPGGGTILSSANPATVSYSTNGLKTVYVSANSATTGLSCSNGTMSAQFTIGGITPPPSTTLSCTANTSPNYSYAGNYVYGWAEITGQGAGGVQLYEVSSSTASQMGGFLSPPTGAYLYFPKYGTWFLTFKIRDAAGNTATCTKYQYVY